MKLVECYPESPQIRKFVDRYQFYEIEKSSFIKAVPNAKIEAWIIHRGAVQLWNPEKNKFNPNKESTFFPATNKASLFRISDHLICLNIKMNLSVLALDCFKDFPRIWDRLKVERWIGSEAYHSIKNLEFLDGDTINVPLLDGLMKTAFENQVEDPQAARLIDSIQTTIPGEQSTDSLAEKMNVSTKTLERLTKKYFDFSPKDLSSIFRFEQTTAHLKSHESQRFIDALAFGYYDQSHFIKECRKITGYAPTAFFSKLKLSTNDVIFE